MSPSAVLAQAFQRSQAFVSRLDRYRGPLEPPDDSALEDVCATLWERKGKRLRSRFVLWFAELGGYPLETSKMS